MKILGSSQALIKFHVPYRKKTCTEIHNIGPLKVKSFCQFLFGGIGYAHEQGDNE